jgi:hypothetical protein
MRKPAFKSMSLFRHTFGEAFAHEEVKVLGGSEFKSNCTHCDQPLKCDPCHAGRKIQCPGCNQLIRIPNPPAGSGFTQVHRKSGQMWATHIPKGNKV